MKSRPWYRHPWPWMLIGLTASAVLASLVTLVIAARNPAELVISEAEYRQLRSQFRPDPATDATPAAPEAGADEADDD